MKQTQTTKLVKINLKYRDEICSACGNKFRAGLACEGYFHLIAIGYHSIINRKNLLICNKCKDIIYRLLGNPPTEDLMKAPTKFYTLKSMNNKHPKSSGMIINGKPVKYNLKKLYIATQKFERKMKRKYPWSNVDYFKIAGLKK